MLFCSPGQKTFRRLPARPEVHLRKNRRFYRKKSLTLKYNDFNNMTLITCYSTWFNDNKKHSKHMQWLHAIGQLHYLSFLVSHIRSSIRKSLQFLFINIGQVINFILPSSLNPILSPQLHSLFFYWRFHSFHFPSLPCLPNQSLFNFHTSTVLNITYLQSIAVLTKTKENMDTKNDYIEIFHYNNMYLTCHEVNLQNLESQLFTLHTKERFKPKKHKLYI